MRPTLTDLTNYLNQLQDSQQYDPAVLQKMLDRAESQVLTVLRALVADPTLVFNDTGAVSSIEVFGSASHYLWIPNHQVGSITTVEHLTDAGYTEIPQWYETSAGLFRESFWQSRTGPVEKYRVTAIFGYGEMPDAIAQVIMEVAVNIWRSKDKGGFSETVGVEGFGSIKAVQGLTQNQQSILDAWSQPYRQVAV